MTNLNTELNNTSRFEQMYVKGYSDGMNFRPPLDPGALTKIYIDLWLVERWAYKKGYIDGSRRLRSAMVDANNNYVADSDSAKLTMSKLPKSYSGVEVGEFDAAYDSTKRIIEECPVLLTLYPFLTDDEKSKDVEKDIEPAKGTSDTSVETYNHVRYLVEHDLEVLNKVYEYLKKVSE